MNDEYSSFSVLSLADWQPSLQADGNSYDKLNRRNDGHFGLSSNNVNCRFFISGVTLEVLANDTKVYSYTLDEDDMSLLSEDGLRFIFHTASRFQKIIQQKITPLDCTGIIPR